MPYACSLDDLLAILRERAPAKAEAVAVERRRVEHGLLSVGLKVHCMGKGTEFVPLVQRLGGAQRALEINVYRHAQASLCLVLPPVGSARAAVLLLECIDLHRLPAVRQRQRFRSRCARPAGSTRAAPRCWASASIWARTRFGAMRRATSRPR